MSEVTRFLAPSNPLRRAGYRYLMSFSLLVAMGGGFHFIGSYWILYTDTSSPSSVAWLILAYWVPSLFVMPFAGVLVDRWNRRLILAATCAYLATLSSAVAVIMVTGHFQVEYLYLYGALSSLAHGVYWNALLAYLKDSLTTEELLHANSLNTALFQGGYLLGAGLAGILFYWIDALGCFAIDAASLSIGVLGWLTITRWFADKTHFRDASTKSSFLIDYWEGLQHVRSDWPLFLFALFAIVPRISAQMLNVLVVGFSKDVLSAGSAGFGVLDMAYGFGAMGCGFGLPLFLRPIQAAGDTADGRVGGSRDFMPCCKLHRESGHGCSRARLFRSLCAYRWDSRQYGVAARGLARSDRTHHKHDPSLSVLDDSAHHLVARRVCQHGARPPDTPSCTSR